MEFEDFPSPTPLLASERANFTHKRNQDRGIRLAFVSI